MPRRRLRSQGEVVARCLALQAAVRDALARVETGEEDPDAVDAVWQAEALGTLLWALQLVELPPYDQHFDPADVTDTPLDGAELRDAEELRLECESARLWHWRARTRELQARDDVELPDRFGSFDALIAATAMRGFEDGVLPAPTRGDFAAFGRVYRQLSPEQYAEVRSIAVERHHALNWLCGAGGGWDNVPLDT